jgi:hypothetical protein
MSPIYCALVGWSARPRLEPSQAIGTIRALPRPPSTRLGLHALYILFHSLFGLTLVHLGTEFPLLLVNTVFHRVNVLFSCKANYCCVSLIKEDSMAAVGQSYSGEVEH